MALLGLLFMKALGDVLVAPGSSRGRSAEALEPAWEVIEATPVEPAAPRSSPNKHGDEAIGQDAAN